MGCDIHMFVEKKNSNSWGIVKGKNPWYGKWEDETKYCYEGWIYNDRNYDLFAILANVRNGKGFAGCDTGDGFNPISMPKGLPNNVSEYVKKQSEEEGYDGHNHSWFTLKELLEYDWSQTTKHRGWVSLEKYKDYKKTNNPYPCSGGIGGGGTLKISNKRADEILNKECPTQQNEFYYTQIEWENTYKESAKFDKVINQLKFLSDDNKGEDIRIVFWFDN